MLLNNVPLTGQTLGVTRVPINQNFITIDAAFVEDHVGYTLAGQGRHNKVSFPVQNPVPAPQAGICQLYSAISAITNQPELVFTHQAGSTAPDSAKIVEFTSAGWTNPGWCRLPSGILMKWNAGIIFTAPTFEVSINSATVFPGSPNFTEYFTSVLTTIDTAANYNNVIGVAAFSISTKVLTIAAMNGRTPPGTVKVGILIIGM